MFKERYEPYITYGGKKACIPHGVNLPLIPGIPIDPAV
jgi:hypothetical protein